MTIMVIRLTIDIANRSKKKSLIFKIGLGKGVFFLYNYYVI
jgi:hypothetical protein